MTHLNILVSTAHADAPPVPAGTQTPVPTTSTTAPASGSGMSPAAQQPSMFSAFLPLVLMIGVMYFLMIRPQQKRQKKQAEMLSQLSTGDEVVTASGLIGKIHGVADKVVTLEIAKDVRVKVLKSQVNQVLKGPIQELV